MLLNPREEYFKNQGIKEGLEEGKKEGLKEGIKEGLEEGKKEVKIEIAIKLLNKGMPIKEIIEITGLTENQILNAK